jgi:hypothetical protein
MLFYIDTIYYGYYRLIYAMDTTDATGAARY